jgi:hypothetical protein
MRQRGDGVRLALEATGVRLRSEQPQRDASFELPVDGAPDLGHAAGPEQLFEPVSVGDDPFHSVGLLMRRSDAC